MTEVAKAQAVLDGFAKYELHLAEQKEAFLRREAVDDDEEEQTKEDLSNPRLVADDMAMYKDYFAKLKFRYLEQVTKETFLGQILADEPVCIETDDIARLEEENAESKQVLKQRKKSLLEGQKQVTDLIEKISEQYETLDAELHEVATLVAEMTDLQAELDAFRSMYKEGDNRMTPGVAARVLEDQVTDLQALNARYEELQAQQTNLKNVLLQLHRAKTALEPELRESAVKVSRAQDEARATEAVESVNTYLQTLTDVYKHIMCIDEFEKGEDWIKIKYRCKTGPVTISIAFNHGLITSADGEGNEDLSDLCEAAIGKDIKGARELVNAILVRCRQL